MAYIVDNILSADDMLYLNSLSHRHHGTSSTFFIELTDSIRSALSPLGMDLSNIAKIPMRWIHRDTAPHTDSGATPFTKTILVYLNDSTGEFIVGDTAHPIKANTAFVFDEGIPHRAVGTEPRLVIGPMSERAEPVGYRIRYYANEADALSDTNLIGYSNTYTLETVGGFSNWTLASNSNGSSPQNIPYAAGSVAAILFIRPRYLVQYLVQYLYSVPPRFKERPIPFTIIRLPMIRLF